jgi:hypothetical protein
MFVIALISSVSLPVFATDEIMGDCLHMQSQSSLGCIGFLSAQTNVPQGPIDLLVNPGLARTADGYWLRWQLRSSSGRAMAVEGFERASKNDDPKGWNVPSVFRKVDVPETLAGEHGCRVVGAVIAAGRRLGAWNCESAPGTILATPTPKATYKVLARLSHHYQAIAATPVEHSESSRITLVSFDLHSQTFRMLDLIWR